MQHRPMHVHITPNDKGSPTGKLADAELHFHDGPLDGLKFVGFAVWERRTGTGRNVTFPARAYSVNGERRSFALLRPADPDTTAQDTIRDLVLQAYAAYEQAGQVDYPPAQPEPPAEPPQAEPHAYHDATRDRDQDASRDAQTEPAQPAQPEPQPAQPTAPAPTVFQF